MSTGSASYVALGDPRPRRRPWVRSSTLQPAQASRAPTLLFGYFDIPEELASLLVLTESGSLEVVHALCVCGEVCIQEWFFIDHFFVAQISCFFLASFLGSFSMRRKNNTAITISEMRFTILPIWRGGWCVRFHRCNKEFVRSHHWGKYEMVDGARYGWAKYIGWSMIFRSTRDQGFGRVPVVGGRRTRAWLCTGDVLSGEHGQLGIKLVGWFVAWFVEKEGSNRWEYPEAKAIVCGLNK